MRMLWLKPNSTEKWDMGHAGQAASEQQEVSEPQMS